MFCLWNFPSRWEIIRTEKQVDYESVCHSIIEFQEKHATGWSSGTTGLALEGYLMAPSTNSWIWHRVGYIVEIGPVIDDFPMRNGHVETANFAKIGKSLRSLWKISPLAILSSAGRVLLLSDFRPRGVFRHRSEQGARFFCPARSRWDEFCFTSILSQ